MAERGCKVIEIQTFSNNDIHYNNDVPVLTRDHIDAITEEILQKTIPHALTKQAPVDVELLVEEYFDLHLDYQTLQPDGAILGETIFLQGVREVYDYNSLEPRKIYVNPRTIILDDTMCDVMPTRAKFTLAHEFGHWMLHQVFYSYSSSRACRSHRNQKTHFSHCNAKTPIQWTEWQANNFASSLLLPRDCLRITLREFLEEHSTTWKKLSDFSDYRNREKYDTLLKKIAQIYEVSYETARIRMNKLCGTEYPHV